MWCRGLLLIALCCGCGSSRPNGTETDAAMADGGGDDGATADSASPDAAPSDGAVAIDALPSDANGCSMQPCSLVPQCGCAAPLTCDIDFTGLMGTACRPVDVPGTETSNCSSASECAAGFVCTGGRCQRYCATNADCPQPRALCALQIADQNGSPIPGAVTCSANCDPTNSGAGGCPSGQKCAFFTVAHGGANLDIVNCALPGAGPVGASCIDDSNCSANTRCSTYNSQKRCRKVCNRTTGGSECATVAGTTCVVAGAPLVIGGTEYGVCAP
ncbi:MAG: hypothetical protein IT370_11195 [Deltaproteobacteria bacterium]|nr:hypothetical protein [Deltaproteobacteria bacterium]